MIETVFYLQVLAFFIFLALGVVFRSWPMFLLAAVLSLTIGATLAAGEPIEFFTGAFSMEENADENFWVMSPDVNGLDVSNSSAVNTWHYIFLYGGVVWIIIALLLAVKGKGGVGFGVEDSDG